MESCSLQLTRLRSRRPLPPHLTYLPLAEARSNDKNDPASCFECRLVESAADSSRFSLDWCSETWGRVEHIIVTGSCDRAVVDSLGETWFV